MMKSSSFIRGNLGRAPDGSEISVERISRAISREYRSNGPNSALSNEAVDQSELSSSEPSLSDIIEYDVIVFGDSSSAEVVKVDLPEKKRQVFTRKLRRGLCKMHLRKHKPHKLLKGINLAGLKNGLQQNLLNFFTWERYKNLSYRDLQLLEAGFMNELSMTSLEKFVDNFYVYEYTHLRRKFVLRFLDNVFQDYDDY